MSQNDLTNFKNGIVSLSNKHFGQFNEFMLKRLLDVGYSDSMYYDLQDGQQRIEVKFSRAYDKPNVVFNESTAYSIVMNQTVKPLLYCHEALNTSKFLCNFQHVKETEFDLLFYGIYFADRVMVFLLTKDDWNDPNLCFGRQSLGNSVERQFRIDSKSLPYHLENYHLLTLSYSDLKTLFSP